MELTKKGKKVTLKSDVQIAAYQKRLAGCVKGKKPKPKPDDPAADTTEK